MQLFILCKLLVIRDVFGFKFDWLYFDYFLMYILYVSICILKALKRFELFETQKGKKTLCEH